MIAKTIKDICLGESSSFSKTITEADVVLFAGVTGDMNPVHMNDVYAKASMFKNRICHGGLVSALFSTVLGTSLPGVGTIYLSQESKFIKPVYLNDTITATVEVIEILESKNRVVLKTTATNQNGDIVVTGQALVMPPR
jgi:3-hydroxybutyryl-CoA dehydratase